MNKKKNKRLFKKSNAGMSLLEVIVAVSIFSITAIILLQGFVTSSRVNRKSNLYLEATTTAQNIMEEIKAKRFEEVCLAFNYPVEGAGQARFTFLQPHVSEIQSGALGIKEVLKVNDEYKDVALYHDSFKDDESQVTASVISTDEGKTYKFNPREKGTNASKYYFEMTNVQNNHETFDALIEFDGSRDTEYKKKTVSNDQDGKNDYQIPNIAKLDSASNASLIMNPQKDEEMINDIIETQYRNIHDKKWSEEYNKWLSDNTRTEEIKDETIHHPTAEEINQYKTVINPEPRKFTYEEVYRSLKRSLYIKLEENNGNVVAKAKYVLSAYDAKKDNYTKYERMDLCPCGGKKEKQSDSDCFCTIGEKDEYSTFYGAEADQVLKRIYLFYYPNYNSKSKDSPLDYIEVDNSINHSIDLYIVKQKQDLDDGTRIPTFLQELSYRMSLTVKEAPGSREKNPNSGWNTNPGLFKGMTKLRTNLDFDISSDDITAERKKISQMKLTFQDAENPLKKVSTNSAKKILSCNGLDDRESGDRIYTAKVTIYKQGAAERNFPQEDEILSLDGAKEN